MRSAFSSSPERECAPIEVIVESENSKAHFSLTNDNKPYSKWECHTDYTEEGDAAPELSDVINDLFFSRKLPKNKRKKIMESLNIVLSIIEEVKGIDDGLAKDEYIREHLSKRIKPGDALFEHFLENEDRMNEIGIPLSNFITFAPENSQLRNQEISSTIEPLGIKGEGLLKLVFFISQFDEDFKLVKDNLRLLGWFSDLTVREESSGYGLEIKDLYCEDAGCALDQNAVNEGFMFLLFYFALFAAPIGSTFFAIDNIDTSLNPKLCQKLIKQLVDIAKLKNKQVILTTHNPAILDGLNLDDEEQKLYAVSRSRGGQTKVSRIEKPKDIKGAPQLRLSEMFLRGLIGGLPKGF